MKNLLNAFFLLFLPIPLVASDIWVFEGLIETVPSELSETVRTGWVLSGSFAYDTSMAEWTSLDKHKGRYDEGISEAELTIDHHFLIQYEAVQSKGAISLELVNNDPDQRGQDFIGINLPVRGLGENDDSPSPLLWAQLWLYDSDGDMVRVGQHPLNNDNVDWKKGWFRLSFGVADGEYLYVEGYITRFNRYDPSEENLVEDYKSVIASLGTQLARREIAFSELESALKSSHDRIKSLDQMIDLLIAERAQLQEANEILRTQSRPDDALNNTVDQLTAEKVILEKNLQSALSEVKELSENMIDVNYERHQMAAEMDELRAEIEALRQRTESEESSGKSSGMRSIPIIESVQDRNVETPKIILRVEEEAPKTDNNECTLKTFSQRKRGPRSKF